MALPGAARYLAPNKTATCKRCGTFQLAWAQNKAGRWYLCQTFRSQSLTRDAVVVAPWAVHICPTEPYRADGAFNRVDPATLSVTPEQGHNEICPCKECVPPLVDDDPDDDDCHGPDMDWWDDPNCVSGPNYGPMA